MSKASKEEAKRLDNLIDEWHEGEDPRPLHEFLGMTLRQYEIWVTTLDFIPVTTKKR